MLTIGGHMTSGWGCHWCDNLFRDVTHPIYGDIQDAESDSLSLDAFAGCAYESEMALLSRLVAMTTDTTWHNTR